MRTISHWAKNNIWKSRLTILACKIALSIIGLCWGFLITKDISHTLFSLSAAMLLAGMLMYPFNKPTGKWSHSFTYRKGCDGILVFASLLLWIGIGNMNMDTEPATGFSTALSSHDPSKQNTLQRNGGVLYASMELPRKQEAGKTKFKWLTSFKSVKKELKQLKRLVKTSMKNDDSPDKGKKNAARILLSLLLSALILFGLGGLTIGLSCSLSCNGQEAAAMVVLIGGISLTIFLIVILWRHIMKRIHQDKENEKMLNENPSKLQGK